MLDLSYYYMFIQLHDLYHLFILYLNIIDQSLLTLRQIRSGLLTGTFRAIDNTTVAVESDHQNITR